MSYSIHDEATEKYVANKTLIDQLRFAADELESANKLLAKREIHAADYRTKDVIESMITKLMHAQKEHYALIIKRLRWDASINR